MQACLAVPEEGSDKETWNRSGQQYIWCFVWLVFIDVYKRQVQKRPCQLDRDYHSSSVLRHSGRCGGIRCCQLCKPPPGGELSPCLLYTSRCV